MADKMKQQYGDKIQDVQLVPSSGGAFEVTVGEELVYSKLETGLFPSEGAVVADMASKL